jgi:hypothetical protein
MWDAGIALVVTAGFLWGAPWRQGEVIRVVRAIQRSVLFVGIALILLLTTYPLQQLGYAFNQPRWPYGYGIGTCTLGTQYVIRIMHATPMRAAVESGFGNLVVELGIVDPHSLDCSRLFHLFFFLESRKGAPGHALVSPGFHDLLIRSSPLLSDDVYELH